MSNERKLRLIQVAKEFKVGLNTITDFLQKKGIKTDGSPNTLVEPDVYAVLEKEFGGSRITGNERESIRERISQKQATITLEEAQKQTREEEQEVIIKSNVISVKDELPQPKILGKIDLSPKPKPAPKPVSKPAAEPVPEAAAPKPQPAPQPKQPPVEVSQPSFQTLDGHAQVEGDNLDLLMDIPLNLSVVLGTSKKSVREILSFNTGSVIELSLIHI